ncbi:amidoligase family protein [Brevibacillus choshinensis]|uniref:amidoligase family protein n=1 Tax=Brevibacillus choshinensis TaxID=54911 RepID=UPI002E2063AF|nr:amidoligase family protein [Brevibacillus choshinensis]MED4755650.1 amidoligase family protein [Brevibacillus choshinensis]MED4784846.1 amidoligase family protein [Brevibacillus choshinensis]
MKPLLMDWKDLYFGVEIEFVGGKPENVELLPGWTMALDEQQIDDTGEESGSELQTPPIQWEEREQIREMLLRLLATGARVNWNCGLHVHVGLEPWGEEAIPDFIEAALQHQESVKYLFKTSEDRLVYCPPVSREMRDRFISAPGEAALRRKGRPQSHRCGINLAAWFDNRTVEIRYANGTLNYDEVITSIEFCLRFIAAIGARRTLSCNPKKMANELGVPLTGYPQPIPAPLWYRERIWLENMLVPILTPITTSLVRDSEILHILPRPDGLLVALENTDGKIMRYLFHVSPTS